MKLGFNNFGKSTELFMTLLIVERASHASEANFVKNKSFMLSEGILERILQNKPCFKFRKPVNATLIFLLIRLCAPLSFNNNKSNFYIELDFSAYKPVCHHLIMINPIFISNWTFLLISLCAPLSADNNKPNFI